MVLASWATHVPPHTVAAGVSTYLGRPSTFCPVNTPMKKTARPCTRVCPRPRLRRLARQSGAAAVEFALLLPVLLLIVFGVIEMSIALYNKTVITQASREAARVGIVLASPRASDAVIAQRVTDHAQPVLVQLGQAGQLTTNVDRSNPAQIRVTVQYTYPGLLLGGWIGRSDNDWKISASTVMVYE